jgi:hypothetical protein
MTPDASGSLERLDVLVGEWETNVPGVEAGAPAGPTCTGAWVKQPAPS